MSWKGTAGPAIATLAVFAGAVLVGRPEPLAEQAPPTSRALAGAGARGAEDRMTIRGEIQAVSPSGRPCLPYFLFVPVAASGDTPLLVAIHGISRNAREQAEEFAPLAASHGFSVVAPLFDEATYEDYQRLGRRGHGARADAALDRLIGELEASGVPSETIFLFGYSGGGQFVHRYAMAHPERVQAAIVSAAGWYTFPDPSLAYPYGIRVGAELPGVRLRPSAFLRVPMLAVVGDEDRERDENLRRSHALDRRQGRNRVDRARRWVRAMQEAARRRDMQPRVELALLDDAGHSFAESMEAGLGELVADYVDRWRGSLRESQRRGPRESSQAVPGGRWCVADGR